MLFFAALLCLSAIGTLSVPIEKENANVDYLLPTNVIPSHYDIKIDVTSSFINEPKNFDGNVQITAQATGTTSIKKITLHAAFMTIKSVKVYLSNDSNKKNLYVDKVMDEEKQFLILEVEEIVTKQNFVIDINYEGTLHTDMHGFYVSSYLEENDPKKREYVLTTQFQPTHARKAFPCFDEPKYKATFIITVKKPELYKVISNTPAEETNSNLNEVTFKKTNKMSTYLVAFIVSKFGFEKHANNENYKVWSRPEALNQTKKAIEASVPLVETLNKFTGINYDDYVKKLDMAALPDFSAGAMENWGLLTYRETALLFDENLSTNKDLQRVITVIAHELGHQWFGNLVTTEWWDNTWLNEGFARYIEYMITGRYLPEWEMESQFVVEQVQSIFEVDALKKTTPLNNPVYTPEDISSHFGTISYSKGGSVIRMMEHFLGTDIFEKGLNNYLKHRELSNTVPDNLWEDLNVYASQSPDMEFSMAKIMNPWINQRGYPLVTVKVENGYVSFEQNRFFLNPEENKDSTEKWYIPISYTTSSEKNFTYTKPKLWLTPQETKKIIQENDSDWIIANIQETGYFRVNYNDAHWKKIAQALISNNTDIDRINRAQIVDDVMNLARAGTVDYNIAFDVVDYLVHETDYYPWYSAFRAFRFLLQRYSETGGAGEQLRTYIKNLMTHLLKDKNLIKLTAEKQIDIFNVVSALEWACNLGVEECVKDAKELFTKETKDINKNFRSIVYCTAIKHGTKKDWDTLWEQYVNSNVAAEKVSIINALGCSTDKEILDAYLLKSIEDEKVRSQDASYVFTAVYTSGPEGLTAALNFLEKYSNEITIKYGGMNALGNAVLGLAGRLTEDVQINKLNSILKTITLTEDIKQAAKETTVQNTKWANQYGTSIENILKQKNSAIRSFINHITMFLSLAFISFYYKNN